MSVILSFCANGLGPMKFITGRVTSNVYLDYLATDVLPFAERTYGTGNFFILHDNAPIHSSAIVSEFLIANLPGRVLEHPPYSPDLNPIENLGSLFKRCFRKHLKSSSPRSKFEFEILARISWNEIGNRNELIQPLIQ